MPTDTITTPARPFGTIDWPLPELTNLPDARGCMLYRVHNSSGITASMARERQALFSQVRTFFGLHADRRYSGATLQMFSDLAAGYIDSRPFSVVGVYSPPGYDEVTEVKTGGVDAMMVVNHMAEGDSRGYLCVKRSARGRGAGAYLAGLVAPHEFGQVTFVAKNNNIGALKLAARIQAIPQMVTPQGLVHWLAGCPGSLESQHDYDPQV